MAKVKIINANTTNGVLEAEMNAFLKQIKKDYTVLSVDVKSPPGYMDVGIILYERKKK